MYDTLTLNTEATVEVTGTLQVVPESKTMPGGHELNADYWHVLGASPGGSDVFTNQVNKVLVMTRSTPGPDPVPASTRPRTDPRRFIANALRVASCHVTHSRRAHPHDARTRHGPRGP